MGRGAAPDNRKGQPGTFKGERRIMTTRGNCMTFAMCLSQVSLSIDIFRWHLQSGKPKPEIVGYPDLSGVWVWAADMLRSRKPAYETAFEWSAPLESHCR